MDLQVAIKFITVTGRRLRFRVKKLLFKSKFKKKIKFKFAKVKEFHKIKREIC